MMLQKEFSHQKSRVSELSDLSELSQQNCIVVNVLSSICMC